METSKRQSNKAFSRDWKKKLRESCLERVRIQRSEILWKTRSPDNFKSAFKDILEDEVRKLSSDAEYRADMLWEDSSGSHFFADDYEELMLAMQQCIYEPANQDDIEDYEDVELREQLSLSDLLEQAQKPEANSIPCPVCKHSYLRQAGDTIRCTRGCFSLKLDPREDGLYVLKNRLAELLDVHFRSGCAGQPSFSFENHLQALFMNCQTCDVLELVL